MSSSSSRRAINVVAPRFQSAVRKLCNDGVEALKPQLVVTTGPESKVWSRSRRPDDGVWRKPAISNRQMNVLRKQRWREFDFLTTFSLASVPYNDFQTSWVVSPHVWRHSILQSLRPYPPYSFQFFVPVVLGYDDASTFWERAN